MSEISFDPEKFDATDMIKRIREGNVAGLIEHKKEELPLSQIVPANKLTKKELVELLSIKEVTAEDILKKRIEILLKTSEPKNVDKTNAELTDMFEEFPKMKEEAKSQLEALIIIIKEELEKSENNPELFDKIDALSTVWNKFF